MWRRQRLSGPPGAAVMATHHRDHRLSGLLRGPSSLPRFARRRRSLRSARRGRPGGDARAAAMAQRHVRGGPAAVLTCDATGRERLRIEGSRRCRPSKRSGQRVRGRGELGHVVSLSLSVAGRTLSCRRVAGLARPATERPCCNESRTSAPRRPHPPFTRRAVHPVSAPPRRDGSDRLRSRPKPCCRWRRPYPAWRRPTPVRWRRPCTRPRSFRRRPPSRSHPTPPALRRPAAA